MELSGLNGAALQRHQRKSANVEDFTIESIGGVNKLLLHDTYSAYCYPKSNPKQKFGVTMGLNYDTKQMFDGYTNLIMQDKYTKYAQGIAHPIWKDDAYVQANFAGVSISYDEKDITIDTYLTSGKRSHDSVILYVFLKSSGNSDTENNVKNILEYLNKLEYNKYFMLTVRTFIVDDKTFANIDQLYSGIMKKFNSGSDYPFCIVNVSDGEVKETQAELVKQLKNGTKGDYFE